nr:hypothetical protein [Streptomyces sp. DSM 41633]
YAVSGPEAITAREQTEQLAEALGRPLRFEELTPDRAREALLAKYPRPVAEAFLESAERQRAGAKAAVVPTVRAGPTVRPSVAAARRTPGAAPSGAQITASTAGSLRSRASVVSSASPGVAAHGTVRRVPSTPWA